MTAADPVDLDPRANVPSLPSWLTGKSTIVLLILVVAAAFRLQDLQQPLVDTFSWREASTAMMADNFYQRSWNIFFPEVSWTGPGPSYQGREFQIISYITAVLYSLFGWHDWFGRLVAIAFGVFGVFALHRLVDRTWGTVHAHAAAFMLAIIPGAAFIDRSFLPDPAMLALITTGFWLLILYVQNDRLIFLVGATILTALGILAKLPGIAVLVPMAYAALHITHARGVLTMGRFLLIAFAALLIVAAVFGYYRWAIHLATSYPPYHMAGSGYLWDDGWARLVREDFYLPRAWELATTWLFTLPILILIGIGLLAGPPRWAGKFPDRAPWLFHVWLAAVAIVYVFAAREITANPWNFHSLNVPAAAFAGRGLVVLAGIDGRHRWNWAYWLRIAGVTAIVITFGTIPTLAVLKTPFAENGYQLGRRLSELSQPGDLVIAVAPNVGDPIAIYYSRRRGWVFPPGGGARDWSTFADDPKQAEAELEKLRAEGANWFGVARDAQDSKRRLFVEHHRELIDYLDANAERVVDDDQMLIYRFKRQSGASASQPAVYAASMSSTAGQRWGSRSLK